MTIMDLKPYGDLISICGALLIFFSWLATNTLGERFKKAKAAYETAREKRQLYYTLDDIQRSSAGVAAAVINLHIDSRRLAANLDPRRDEQAVRDSHEHDELRLQLISTILNAGQIDHGNSFCNIVLDQSDPSAKSSVADKQLLESCAKIRALLKEKNSVVEQMQANIARHTQSGEVSLQDVRKERRRLDDAYKAILQSFAPLLRAAVDATNATEDKLRKKYSEARAHSKKANQASLYLYIVGTALVLIGTTLDKLVK